MTVTEYLIGIWKINISDKMLYLHEYKCERTNIATKCKIFMIYLMLHRNLQNKISAKEGIGE